MKNEALGEQMTVIRHKSGLTVYICAKPLASAYAIFGTRYGSFDNELTENGKSVTVPHGIAHFLEHKLFETEDGADSFEIFSELGADANAYTSFDRTAYLFSCTENFYESLEALINMVRTPVFTKQNVEKEQGIIAQEIKMCEDRPTGKLFYDLMRAMYGEHPVSIPIAGTVASIREITPELLYECYGRFYKMSNMAICVCGSVEADRIAEIIDRLIPEEAEWTDGVTFEAKPVSESVITPVVRSKAEISKPLFDIGIKHSGATAQSLAACEILGEAVFGKCEELYGELFERELVSDYQHGYEYSRAAAFFEISGNTPDPDKVLEIFTDAVLKIGRDGVDEAAFGRAKRKAYASAMLGFDDSESIAESVLEGFLVGSECFEMIEDYKRVSLDDVNALAKRLFVSDGIAMSVLYPINGSEDKANEQ